MKDIQLSEKFVNKKNVKDTICEESEKNDNKQYYAFKYQKDAENDTTIIPDDIIMLLNKLESGQKLKDDDRQYLNSMMKKSPKIYLEYRKSFLKHLRMQKKKNYQNFVNNLPLIIKLKLSFCKYVKKAVSKCSIHFKNIYENKIPIIYKKMIEFLNDTKTFFQSIIPDKPVPILATVTVSVICMILFFKPPFDLIKNQENSCLSDNRSLSKQVDICLKLINKHQLIDSNAIFDLIDESKGFNKEKTSKDYIRAYAAGALSARKSLSGIESSAKTKSDFNNFKDKKIWESSEIFNFYYIGQCFFLLNNVCMSASEIPVEFWQHQKEIISNINLVSDDNLSKDSTYQKIDNSLKEIKALIYNYNSKTKCDRIVEIISDISTTL